MNGERGGEREGEKGERGGEGSETWYNLCCDRQELVNHVPKLLQTIKTPSVIHRLRERERERESELYIHLNTVYYIYYV